MKKNTIKWFAFSAVLVVILILIIRFTFIQTQAPVISTELQGMSKQSLEEEKLRQDIIKLQIENRKSNSFWVVLSSNAAFFMALVAAIGAVVTIWKQITERSRQQELDRRQRELDRIQREDESLRRVNEKFTSTVTDLGSESDAIQAGAAISILSFLKPEYKAYHELVYMIILANLKIEHNDAILKILINGFEKAVPLMLKMKREQNEQFELDLSHANLQRIDLTELDLSCADMGYTKMQNAKLVAANLFRARGYNADLTGAWLSKANLNEARFKAAIFEGSLFHEANLASAQLKETNLKKAQFQQAHLQSAHFENADLRGARFEQADINDAFFKGAQLDNQALTSIVRAYNWQNAHFDDQIKMKLDNLVKK